MRVSNKFLDISIIMHTVTAPVKPSIIQFLSSNLALSCLLDRYFKGLRNGMQYVRIGPYLTMLFLTMLNLDSRIKNRYRAHLRTLPVKKFLIGLRRRCTRWIDSQNLFQMV